MLSDHTWEHFDVPPLYEPLDSVTILTFFSNFSYLWYPIPAAILLIAVRTVFEKWVFRPLGTALGLRPTPHRRPPTNDVIEAEFRASEKGVLKEEVALRLAQQTGLSERQVWPLTQSFSSLLFRKKTMELSGG